MLVWNFIDKLGRSIIQISREARLKLDQVANTSESYGGRDGYPVLRRCRTGSQSRPVSM